MYKHHHQFRRSLESRSPPMKSRCWLSAENWLVEFSPAFQTCLDCLATLQNYIQGTRKPVASPENKSIPREPSSNIYPAVGKLEVAPNRFLYSLCSMVLVYLATKLGDFGRLGKCRCAYSSTMGCMWDILYSTRWCPPSYKLVHKPHEYYRYIYHKP